MLTNAAPSSHLESIYPKSKTINLLNIHSRKCLERGPGIGYVERIIGALHATVEEVARIRAGVAQRGRKLADILWRRACQQDP